MLISNRKFWSRQSIKLRKNRKRAPTVKGLQGDHFQTIPRILLAAKRRRLLRPPTSEAMQRISLMGPDIHRNGMLRNMLLQRMNTRFVFRTQKKSGLRMTSAVRFQRTSVNWKAKTYHPSFSWTSQQSQLQHPKSVCKRYQARR